MKQLSDRSMAVAREARVIYSSYPLCDAPLCPYGKPSTHFVSDHPIDEPVRARCDRDQKLKAAALVEAALVAEREAQKEQNAKKCDEVARRYSGGTFNDSSREVRAAEECAAAIRSGGVNETT